ncbi:MAG TPA: class 1 isoprenoid biosynthesis enzyme [Mariniphaga anaerophila]|uniref:Class 1 isoprenoid biosynthesis enzyme n=1 Tax=Mariniphaga anaerophila TaxID=1484053 RepID=A0A831LNX6_9BACT|nr:class 1 isoprenoid biosynthesis enzyme [Mariniphaga anaerophila]
MLAVESYISHFEKLWEKSLNRLPEFDLSYSVEEQVAREASFNGFQDKVKSYQSKKSISALKKSDPGQSFFPVFRAFLQNVFDFEPDQLEIILSDDFKNVSKDFFYKARMFAPELSPENIYQGMRNVWIMNGLQLMMGIPVEITPSVFAYSMIYPYSDNLLDDLAISDEEKKAFSCRFNKRLHGKNVKPQNHAESQLFRLVGLFEDQFSRDKFPKVYESLYAIQQGQTHSLDLINCNGLEEAAVRKICFEKGGASVLADGYLVAGHLSPEKEQALFGYGIYLQLLDDIQDVKEDADAHTKTLFSCLDGTPDLGAFVNRTIHFGRKAMEELRCFDGAEMETMLRLMNRSIETMIIESVGLNPQSYSTEYLKNLEKYSPLRFEFIQEKRTQSKSQRFSLFKKYFEQVPVKRIT